VDARGHYHCGLTFRGLDMGGAGPYSEYSETTLDERERPVQLDEGEQVRNMELMRHTMAAVGRIACVEAHISSTRGWALLNRAQGGELSL
jgi:hypothetical protein